MLIDAGGSVRLGRVIRRSHSLKDTARIARELAGVLRPGDCVALEGGLGAGKTTFVRACVEALGGRPDDVASPTFVLLHTYATPRGPVFHLDAYRLHSGEDLESIGFDELLAQDGFVFLEWASRASEAMPARLIRIAIERIDETTRDFVIDLPA
jgi:tRNA threonylcarbamoyl adenosine modification protein YjeE